MPTINPIDALVYKLKRYNAAYRAGDPVISDEEYDALIGELTDLDPKNEFLRKISDGVSGRVKEKLPVTMRSLNKATTVEDFCSWLSDVGKVLNTVFSVIITGKYDGISLCVDEDNKRAWTSGDGEVGINVTKHFSYFNDCLESFPGVVSIGEAVIKNEVFLSLGTDYKNPRNFVSGRMLALEPHATYLPYFDYKCYGIRWMGTSKFASKKLELDFINRRINNSAVPYIEATAQSLVDRKDLEEYLKSIFLEWAKEYPMDGLVVEVNRYDSRVKLGIGANGNPNYAIAYKAKFEQQGETTVTCIIWHVSKHRLLKPVAAIAPIELNGVTVSNINLDNARYVKENGLGKGARIVVKRSGMVIPRIVFVKDRVTATLPRTCPECGFSVVWSVRHVDIVCPNPECSGAAYKKIVAFFSILGVPDISYGLCEQLIEAGYDTIGKIIRMDVMDFLALEGFQERKAKKIFNNIQTVIRAGVPLYVLQHASGLFPGLGSTKLATIQESYPEASSNFERIPIQSLVDLEGFSDISAHIYDNGIEAFREFIKTVPTIVIGSKKEDIMTEKLKDQVFVFTGFRSDEMEALIRKHSGQVGSGVTKKTTTLVMKEKGSGSSKEAKALRKGIKILSRSEAEKYLNSL